MIKNFKLTLLSLILSGSLLTGCGNDTVNLLGADIYGNVSALSIEDPTPTNLDAINKSIDFSTGTKNTFNNTNVKFYIDGPEAYPAIEELIMSAKESLYVEIFIFRNDYTGRKFADALVNKAQEGVEVKLVYDFVGNPDVKLMNYMAKGGVEIQTYNKQVVSLNTNITHRKVFVADGQRAVTGGMNIGDEYSSGKWHDTLMGFEGDAVKDMLAEFMNDWRAAGGAVSPKMKEAYVKVLSDPEPVAKKLPLRVTVTSPKESNKKEDIKRMLISAIDTAKDNVKVSMPYFSDDEFIEHLIMATKRGVKVMVLLPKKSNSKLFDEVSTITANQLIKGNVEVMRGGAKENTFNHSKVMTVDNVWTTIGSCNADYRAFHSNQELNVAISDPEFTQNFNRGYFEYHLQDSEKGVYVNVPWYKKTLHAFIEGLDNLL